MTTRRNFLKSSFAGLVFCGCGLPWEAHAQKAPARLPVRTKFPSLSERPIPPSPLVAPVGMN